MKYYNKSFNEVYWEEATPLFVENCKKCPEQMIAIIKEFGMSGPKTAIELISLVNSIFPVFGETFMSARIGDKE